MNRPADVLDLFAGPGGWECGHSFGPYGTPLGIEWDDVACATRDAVGLRTMQENVAHLDPRDFPEFTLGLIGSPPCQAYSKAGLRLGRHDRDLVLDALRYLARGQDRRLELAAIAEDPRSLHVVEPFRWAKVLKPRWIALEQVPNVVHLWHVIATLLRYEGYHTWVGVLEAERFGVPQTRERAFLLAHRDRQPHPPQPTHQRFVRGQPPAPVEDLFGGLQPWVSMADALGWPAEDLVGFPRAGDTNGPQIEVDGQALRERDLRPASEPAATLTEKVRSWSRFPARLVAGNQDRATVRAVTEPAPTVAFGHASASFSWDGVERVTPSEAGVLQSFPADYPWQGALTRKYEQIGNAVPPLLASAVIGELA